MHNNYKNQDFIYTQAEAILISGVGGSSLTFPNIVSFQKMPKFILICIKGVYDEASSPQP